MAHQERTSAKSKFTRAYNGVEAAFGEELILTTTIIKRYDVLTASWEKVQEKHETYVSGLTDENEIENAEKWIDDLASKFNTMESKVDRQVMREKMAEVKNERMAIANQEQAERSKEHAREKGIRDQRANLQTNMLQTHAAHWRRGEYTRSNFGSKA